MEPDTQDSQLKPELDMEKFENILAPGHEPSMTKPYNPQVAQEFNTYLNPKTLKRHVLHSEKMQAIIELYSKEMKCSKKNVEQQVRVIIDEIGLDRNLAIIRWCGIAITNIGKRICEGIYVHNEHAQKVKSVLGKQPVLYLPSHRSYMDFILMSYICFHYEIEIPGIAAGMDFHSMFGMGTMLRKTGAFFMRRSFSNDALYWDVFREYMYALVASYHIGVEFFIEGTRSRNFKALTPKVGLLSMAMLPYFTGEVSDITVVPVSISYERVLEEQLFVYELLGVPKPKESTKGFFKALKIIDERFGRMYFDFGAPISVHEFFANNCTDARMERASLGAHLQKLNRHEIELVKQLANQVVYEQQRGIVLSIFNLICVQYASQIYMKQTVNMDNLITTLPLLKHMFEILGARVAISLKALRVEVLKTLEIHKNILHLHGAKLKLTQVIAKQLAQQIDPRRLKAHILSPHTMAIAVPALSLQLYINPCLFWLARPGFVLLAALTWQNKEQPIGTYENIVQGLAERTAHIERIFKNEFIIDSYLEKNVYERNVRFLEEQGILQTGYPNANLNLFDNTCSRILLSALAPFLCLYYQLAITLSELSTTKLYTCKDILINMQERIEKYMSQDQAEHYAKFVHPYCLALDNLNIALSFFTLEGFLIRHKESEKLQLNSECSLEPLIGELRDYCDLLPFKQYYENIVPQAEQSIGVSSKL